MIGFGAFQASVVMLGSATSPVYPAQRRRLLRIGVRLGTIRICGDDQELMRVCFKIKRG